MGAAPLALLLMAEPAFAQCATTTAPDGTVTLTCGTTITSSSINRNGNNPSTNANLQSFEAPVNVTINSGATLNGWGLYVSSRDSQSGTMTPRPINVVNNGTVSHTVGWDDPSESAGLSISSNVGSIRYSGNGSATTNGTANATGNFQASTGLVIYASGLGDSVTFGSQAAPITGATFRGEAGAQLVAERGRLDAWFSGGTITATREESSFSALSIQAADSITLSMIGGTVVNGGINVSQTAGPGHSASSTVTVTTDARVSSTYASGAGLAVFGREGGTDVTLASGASISATNIGVLLNPNTGQSRFASAAGTTISQTGTTGAARIGLWFRPIGTGSLVADLSGGIAASGTGILLTQANGNALVTIRAGASVNGDGTGIQVFQPAGSTGTVDIRNLGTLSGAVAVAGTPAGTAFVLNNSGTMTGAVRVTGAAASSQFTNSGTWNLGSGDSAFSASLANSGTLNMANGAANTLTVNGNLVLSAGSVLRFDIGSNYNDRINVTGTATLTGGFVAIANGSRFTEGTYTLLNAVGGVTGRFSPFTAVPNEVVSLRYDNNNVYLEVAGGSIITTNDSRRESIVFSTPTVTTNRVNAFSTQIIGRLIGGQALYDQTFAAAFNTVTVQNALTAARAAITTAGGPGIIIGDPVRTSSTTTSATTSATAFTLTNTQTNVLTPVTTFGPSTILTGNLSTCNVATLPSSTRPTCVTGGTPTVLEVGSTNFNIITEVTYTVAESRTDTITDTLREVYEINGQVAAVGTIHAEVQSGLFDLGGRLLTRLTGPLPANQGWGEVYAFRVSQQGRRVAQGFAAGANIALAEGLTLAFALDHGSLDIDVPGAQEEGDVTLTEGGVALRLERGPFRAALSATYGAGDVDTRRRIIGSSAASYDVRVGGVALDLGYAFEVGGWTLRPVVGLDYVSVQTDGFVESDTLGLAVGDQDADRVRASAGVELGRSWGNFELSGSARYLSVLDGEERVIPVAFAVAPGRVLEMRAPNEPDTALIGARARLALSQRASLSVSYDGRFGDGYTGHAGTVGLAIAW